MTTGNDHLERGVENLQGRPVANLEQHLAAVTVHPNHNVRELLLEFLQQGFTTGIEQIFVDIFLRRHCKLCKRVIGARVTPVLEVLLDLPDLAQSEYSKNNGIFPKNNFKNKIKIKGSPRHTIPSTAASLVT